MKAALIAFACFFTLTLFARASQVNLHLVPHTHDDLGWLYSVSSYYLGTNPRGCVECIFNNVTLALAENPNRKFSYVEMGYFRIWWSRQNETTQQKFRQFYENGQFEFLNAGIVMNDEGAAYYDDIIEQMSKGLKFVKDTFNYTVQTGWHIDIFGHSAAQASIFSQMGFNSWFFERIDYEDFNNRVATRSLETLWKPKTFSELNYMFTHVNYMSYYLAPFNWCIDMICFPSNTPFDSMQKIFKYSTWVQNLTNFYISDHIQHHVGGDFEWGGDTEHHYQGLEVIIDFFTAHQEFGINAFFSTPSNYTNSLYQEFRDHKTAPLSTKQDDFMSYVDQPHAYWTGFYTSRAVYKRQVRAGGQRLQTVRKLLAKMLLEKPSYFKLNYNDIDPHLDQYEEINAILQHHDSITGTAKQNVTDNYVDMLSCATSDINEIVNSVVANISENSFGEELVYEQCNIESSACKTVFGALVQLQSAVVTIYNPSSESKNLIRIEVPHLQLNVFDQNNTKVAADIICDDYSNLLVCSLYFYTNIPTNSFASYKISLGTVIDSNIVPPVDITQDVNFNIADRFTLKVFENMTDFILIANESTYPFSLNYKYYQSYYEENEQASGAYIFRPAQNYSLPYSKPVSGRYFVGKNLDLVQIKGDKTVASLKLEKYSHYDVPVVQVDTLTLPVDISDGIGKELTINFATPNINNQQMFYTDSNGLEMMERILNHRDTYNVELTEPIAGNYFPVYSAIYIEDPSSHQRMTVVTDRSEGGSSLNTGEIELMIHRRILHDDNRGVDEALNETNANGVGIEVKLSHYLFFSQSQSSLAQRQIQYDLDTQKLVFVATSASDSFSRAHHSVVGDNLASLVKFYIRPYSDTNFLVRLHNLNENENESVNLVDSENRPVVLSHLIGNAYLGVNVVSVEELALGANQNKQDMLNSKFRWDDNFTPVRAEDLNTVELRPLEMRVFNFELGKKYKFLVPNMKDITGRFSQGTESSTENCNCIFTADPTETVPEEERTTSQSPDRNGMTRKRGYLLESLLDAKRRSESSRRY